MRLVMSPVFLNMTKSIEGVEGQTLSSRVSRDRHFHRFHRPFQRKLLTPDSRFDRFIAGASDALSETELLGLEVYLREGCASCHAGPLMGGQDILLIEDYLGNPMGDRFEFRKKLGNSHKFKLSPLRNIGVTAPYLHDGRYASLAESLGGRLTAYQVHEAGITDTVEFSDTEFSALLAFLGSLTVTHWKIIAAAGFDFFFAESSASG